MILLKSEHDVSVTQVLTLVSLFVFTQTSLMDDQFRILYSKEMKCNHNRSLNLNVSETKIYFYDFVNKINVTSQINTAAKAINSSEELNLKRRLIVFVPGYKCHIQRNIEESIRQTFNNVSNVYLIIVDHSKYTYEDENKIGSYLRSVQYSYYIGASLGTFLSNLSDIGFEPNNIHCVGHSLGGHIIGYAAEVYKAIKKEKLFRITGLDPAGPCFSDSPIEEHIRTSIANYVEVYHCNAGHLGTTRTLADTDFFFNYEGKIQPDCDKGLDLEETAKCYHKACAKYWANSVHHRELYLATSCSSYQAFAEGLCDINQKTIAGYFNPEDARGNYYISTDVVP